MASLNWKGDEVKRTAIQNARRAMGEFGLTVEGESKKELRKGHGVITGTLRRSIHTALPGYDWNGDDVQSDNGPERGGQLIDAMQDGDQVTVQVGSGLVYAMAINQGWTSGYKKMKGSFTGYHYINNGLKKAKEKLQTILAKYQVKR